MRLEQLEYLVALAELKSLNLAGERLHISHQAISAALKSLENEINVNLLERSHRGVRLTDAGQIMLEFAKEMLVRYQNTLEKIQATNKDLGGIVCGELIIYSTIVFTISYLAEIINRFRTQFPYVTTSVYTCDSEEIFKRIRSKKNDLAEPNIIGLAVTPYDSTLKQHIWIYDDLSFYPLGKAKAFFYVRNTSSFTKYNSLSIKRILEEPLVIIRTSDKDYKMSMNLLRKYGNPLVNIYATSFEIWRDSILKNDYVGVIFDFAEPEKNLLDKKSLGNITMLNVKENLNNMFGYVTLPKVSPIVREFIKFL